MAQEGGITLPKDWGPMKENGAGKGESAETNARLGPGIESSAKQSF